MSDRAALVLAAVTAVGAAHPARWTLAAGLGIVVAGVVGGGVVGGGVVGGGVVGGGVVGGCVGGGGGVVGFDDGAPVTVSVVMPCVPIGFTAAMVAVPAESPLTTPAAETTATVRLELLQTSGAVVAAVS